MNLEEKKAYIINQNRLHIFKTEKNIYLYDAFSQNIFPVSSSIASFIEEKNTLIYSKTELKEISDFLEYLLKWNGSFSIKKSEECHITINCSNLCNLDCTYCYRDKKNDTSISVEKMLSFISYARKNYMPEAKELVCSMNLTSEPMLELKKLIQLKEKFYLYEDENCFLTMWFMSNGTILSEEAIKFIKQLKISPFWISLDGPEQIHNKHRFFLNGRASHSIVIKNIELLKQHGVKIRLSCVITKDYPNAYELLIYFKSLNIDSVQMTPVRNGLPESFSVEALLELESSYQKIFNMLYVEILEKNFSTVKMLKDDIIMSAFRNLLYRTRQVSRCTWGKELVIDGRGNLYPCLYLINDERYCLGNINEKKSSNDILNPISVEERNGCVSCWARFLCGGTCHYNSIVKGNNEYAIDDIECRTRKFLIIQSINLIIKLIENGVNMNELMFFLN